MADNVVEPIPGPQAFAASGAAAEQSQAAILLAMGMQLRGDPSSLRARAEVTADAGGISVFSSDDLERFPLPPLRSAVTRFSPPDPAPVLRGMVREQAAEYAASGARVELAQQV